MRAQSARPGRTARGARRRGLLACLALAVSCTRTPAAGADAAAPASHREAKPTMSVQRDEHSYSEPDKVRIADLALDLALDFGRKQLSGTST